MKIRGKIILLIVLSPIFLITFSITLNAYQEISYERKFVSVGPPESEGLEKALDKKLAVYAYGFWPREEKFEDSKSSNELPKKYVDRLDVWVHKIINKNLLPESIDPNVWKGIKKLHLRDYIVGQFKSPQKDITLKIQADGLLFLITAESDEFFPDGVSGLTNEQIIKTITSLVNYPKEEVNDIILEKNTELLGDDKFKTNVCYGKIRDGQYDPMRGPGPTGNIEEALKDFTAGKITKRELDARTEMKNIPT